MIEKIRNTVLDIMLLMALVSFTIFLCRPPETFHSAQLVKPDIIHQIQPIF